MFLYRPYGGETYHLNLWNLIQFYVHPQSDIIHLKQRANQSQVHVPKPGASCRQRQISQFQDRLDADKEVSPRNYAPRTCRRRHLTEAFPGYVKLLVWYRGWKPLEAIAPRLAG